MSALDVEFVWIEEVGTSNLDRESKLVFDYLNSKNVEVRLFTKKLVNRRTLPMTINTPVVGTIPVVHGTLRQLGVEPPHPDDYPMTLRHLLHRHVTRSTLFELFHRPVEKAIFVKPARTLKKFTGRVIYDYRDLYLPPTTGMRTEIWISEVVKWLTEYRVYVIDGAVVSVDHYDGDPTIQIDMAEVELAIEMYDTAPSAYAIDFGVLSSGQTALIEVNDGYSLGAYGINADLYTTLLLTRWRELTKGSRTDQI